MRIAVGVYVGTSDGNMVGAEVEVVTVGMNSVVVGVTVDKDAGECVGDDVGAHVNDPPVDVHSGVSRRSRAR